MKTIKHSTLIVSLLILFIVTSGLGAAVPGDKQKKENEEKQKMIKLWKEYATPGENHKHLEYYIGQWESVRKVWEEPGAEAVITKQEITVEPIFGGRYLKAHIKLKGDIMGMPFESMILTGYDNYKKQFFAIAVSSLDTGYQVSTGTLDKTGKIRTETGVLDDVMTGKKFKIKAVTTIIDRNKYLYQLYEIDSSGSEIKLMEITYTRKNQALD